MPGGRGVFPSLTVAENLRLGGWLHRRDHGVGRRRAERALALFPLAGRRRRTQGRSALRRRAADARPRHGLLAGPSCCSSTSCPSAWRPRWSPHCSTSSATLNGDGVTIVVVEQSVNVAPPRRPRGVPGEGPGPLHRADRRTARPPATSLRAVFLGPAAAVAPPTGRRSAPRRSVRRRVAGSDVARAHSALRRDRRCRRRRPRGGAPARSLGIIGTQRRRQDDALRPAAPASSPPTRDAIHLDGHDLTDVGPRPRSARPGPVVPGRPPLPRADRPRRPGRRPRTAPGRPRPAGRAWPAGGSPSETAVADRVDELLETAAASDRYRDAFIVRALHRHPAHRRAGVRRSPTTQRCSCSTSRRRASPSGRPRRSAELLTDLRARAGAAMVVIEHDIPLVSSIADRLICLHLGRVIVEGRPDVVLADPTVVASYLGTDDATIARSGHQPEDDPDAVRPVRSRCPHGPVPRVRVVARRRARAPLGRDGHLRAVPPRRRRGPSATATSSAPTPCEGSS